ncbi:MAG TPA: hypothetical protein PLP19_22230 [bacterium]|nr:hypothetical protein [bacterium]HPN46219.1 hypothetical protein [bacterium]
MNALMISKKTPYILRSFPWFAVFLLCAHLMMLASLQADQLYFNQTIPGLTAQCFAPGLVSTQNLEHSRMIFSGNMQEMFWATVPVPINEETDETRIYYVRKMLTGWSNPEILSLPVGNGRSPVLSPDDSTLYFLATDPASKNEIPPRQLIFQVDRLKNGWGLPQPCSTLPIITQGKMTLAFCFAENRNLYFDLGGPDENGRWRWKIYCAEFKDGRYREAKLLDDRINLGNNQTPFIAPDESFIIFSSWREGNLGGGDLYIAYRIKDGGWNEPVNLGTLVNTGAQERFPGLTPDGKYLFFTRSRKETKDDFYWIDAEIIGKEKQ